MTFQSFSGKQYMQIDVANNFGLDKLNWDDRLDWFLSNENQLEDRLKEAEEPALYFASVLAYRKAQAGKPVAYPISLDATASGLQISSALTGCAISGRLCNVVDTGNREDAYTNVYEAMLRGAELVAGSGRIDRKDVKRAVMTSFYGSKAQPKKVFGEGPMLKLFYSTIATAAPGAWELNEALLSMWNPTALSNDWVMPDGFNVHIKIMDHVQDIVHFMNEPFTVIRKENRPKKDGRSLGANTHHSVDGMVVREMDRRCNYDPIKIEKLKSDCFGKGMSLNRLQDRKVRELWKAYELSGFLSARILTYLDRDNAGHVDPVRILKLINTLPKKPFSVLSVHDCFRCLPNYGNDLRIQYNTILAEIAESEMLRFIVSQLLGKVVDVQKKGQIGDYIRKANYALS